MHISYLQSHGVETYLRLWCHISMVCLQCPDCWEFKRIGIKSSFFQSCKHGDIVCIHLQVTNILGINIKIKSFITNITFSDLIVFVLVDVVGWSAVFLSTYLAVLGKVLGISSQYMWKRVYNRIQSNTTVKVTTISKLTRKKKYTHLPWHNVSKTLKQRVGHALCNTELI